MQPLKAGLMTKNIGIESLREVNGGLGSRQERHMSYFQSGHQGRELGGLWYPPELGVGQYLRISTKSDLKSFVSVSGFVDVLKMDRNVALHTSVYLSHPRPFSKLKLS